MQYTRICSVAASAPEGSGFQGTAAITLLLTRDYTLDFVFAAVVERPSFHGMLSQSINTSKVGSSSPRCPRWTSDHKARADAVATRACSIATLWEDSLCGVILREVCRHLARRAGSHARAAGFSPWRNVPCSGVPDEPTWYLAIRHGSAVRACSFTGAGRSASGIAAVSGENSQRLPTLSPAPQFIPGVAGSIPAGGATFHAAPGRFVMGRSAARLPNRQDCRHSADGICAPVGSRPSTIQRGGLGKAGARTRGLSLYSTTFVAWARSSLKMRRVGGISESSSTTITAHTMIT